MPRSKFTKERQDVLLDWTTKMLADGKQKPGPKQIEDFYDGAVFSDLLSLFDSSYDPTELEENLSIAASSGGRPVEGRRRNLHIVHIALRDFIRRHCQDVEVLVKDINFQSLVKQPEPEGMFQLLSVFLVASVNTTDSQLSRDVLTDMQASLDPAGMLQLMAIMQESQARIQQGAMASETSHDASSAAPSSVTAPTTAAPAETDYELEAEMARLRRDNDRYTRLAADLKTKHDHLQDSYNELKEIHADTVQERDDLQRELDSGASNSELLARFKKERDEKIRLIDSLEIQMEELRMQKEAFEQLSKRLENENKRLAPLKANTAEHLKQKLETLRPLENEVQKLRGERADIYKEQEKMIAVQRHFTQLKSENDKYAMKMSQYEVQESEFRDQRAAFTMQIQQLQRHAENLEMKAKHDEEMVMDLQEKVMLLDPSAAPETPYAARPQAQSLEDELNGNVASDVSLKDLEVSRLQAENVMLKASIGTETEKGQLLQQIEAELEHRKALQEKYNELFEKHTIGQESLNALINNMDGEGNEAYSNLRKQVLAEENRSKHLGRQLESMQAELKDKERELVEARGDSKIIYLEYLKRDGDDVTDIDDQVNALSKEGQDVLSELKETDNMLAVSLRAELDGLRRKYDILKGDYDSKQEQLIVALIDKEQLRKEAETANNELHKAIDGQAVNPDVAKTTEKMEKLRTRYKKLSEQLDQSEQHRHDLEKTVKDLRAGTTDGAQKTQQELVIKNLQRENAMIATAWYDLTSRLQSNHVVLQRRGDAPKSWLNKQRQMVNG
ncbi:microtubule binding protein HOOK3 [Apiospora kogelbergensis]|uniref:Microtubule binding protein HOOK3 n=1 Tax=Apiospora kogelbergensis TaxID=1337665 RepID=A0AAW0R7D4_9PEZI